MIPLAGRPEGGVSHRHAPSVERGSGSESLSSLLVLLLQSSVSVWVPQLSWRVVLSLSLCVSASPAGLHVTAERLLTTAWCCSRKLQLDAVVALWCLGARVPQCCS